MNGALIIHFRLFSVCKKHFALPALLFLFSRLVFAQAPDSWTKMSDMPGQAAARDRASSFSINGIGYIGLGSDGGSNFYNGLWAYDPSTDTWTQKADLTAGNGSRCRAFSFSFNGKGYVGTGWDGAYLQGVFEYDPVTNGWTTKNFFGGGGCFGTSCFTVGNKAYVTGGNDGSLILNQHWEYDPASDAWTQKANIPAARYSAAAFAIGINGYVGTGYGGGYLNDFWRYNTVTNTWKKVADLPGGVRALACAFSLGPRGFVIGGSDSGPLAKSDVWEYNPFIDTWTQKAAFGGGLRFGSSAFVIGNNAFVGVGNNNTVSVPGNPLKDLWKYTPSPLSNDMFQKTYGGTNSDTDSSNLAFASPTPDGGYIISSTTKSFGIGGDDVYVLKTDPAGVVQWGKTFGGTANETSASIRPAQDGGYILAGSIRRTSLDEDMLVIKITSAGSLQWNRTIAGTQTTKANYAEETNAGGEFLVTGKGALPGWSNTALIKFSSSGTPVFSQNISVPSSIDEGFSITQTTSGNYVIAGNMVSGTTDLDGYLVALNNTGNIIPGAQARFDSPGLNGSEIRSLARQTDDGGFIICGSSNAPGFTHGLFDFFLIKIQNNLSISWAKCYGGTENDVARSIAITNDGNFAVAGFTRSYGKGTDAFLSLIDPNGTPLWSKTYGGSAMERANSVYQAADGGFILCGETFSLGSITNAVSDIYLVKTDNAGNSGCYDSSITMLPVLNLGFSQSFVSGTSQPLPVNPIAVGQTTANSPANPVCAKCTFPLVKTKTNVKCFGTGTGSASAATTSGTNPYTYLWSTGATTSSVSGLAAGTYSVLVVDANLCSATDTIKISQPPQLTMTPSADSVAVCKGSSSTLGVSGAGGSPPLTYLWNPSAGLSCSTCLTPVASPTVSTTYIVSVTDAQSCVKKDSVHVSIHNAPLADAGVAQSVCGGVPASLGGPSIGGINYSWSPTAGLSNSTLSNPFANPTSSTGYILTVSDMFGCSDKDTVLVTVVAAPVITVASTYSTICTGINNTTLTAASAGAAAYLWSPGGQNNDTIVVSPQTTTTYSVQVTSTGGCKVIKTITVNVIANPYSPPVVNPTTNSYCPGENIQPFTVTNANGFVVWLTLTGGLISTGTTYQPVGPFSGYVVQGGLGCFSYPTMVSVTMDSLPTADAGPDVTICSGHTVQLQASGGVSYVWSPDSALSASNISGPSASPDSTFSYQVEVADANGCKDKDSVTVFIMFSDSCGIHIFNVITPNSDGFNEGWWIDGIAAYPENTVTIFNRWGTKVWGRQNYDNKKVIWKGRSDNGEPLPAGTYYYVITIKGKTYSKWVELLR